MTLNKLAFSLLGTLAIATTGSAGTAPSGKACKSCCAPAAAEQDLGLTLGVGYDSNFIFRGLNLADNWVSANVGYSLPLTSAVKLNLDANYGTSADDQFLGVNNASYQRLELGAGISTDIGGAELGLGYRYYKHMGDASTLLQDTSEVGLTLATKAGPLNVGVAANYDIDGEGWYFEAGVNSEIKISETISLVPGASIGYGVDYNYQLGGLAQTVANLLGVNTKVDGFTAVNLSLALPIKLTKNATLTPFIAYNIAIDALKDLGEDDQLHGGASINVKF